MKLHYPKGMEFHGENACKYHGFERYDWQTDRDKPALFWLYHEDDYKYLANHTGKKYIFWNGSDVPRLANNFVQIGINLVRDTSIVHACQNSMLQAELAVMGIHAVVRPLFYGDVSKYKPSKKLTKDCYMVANKGRGIEYGESIFNALAWQFPDWTFHIFGIDPTIPVYCDNLKYYGWVTDMDEIVKDFGLCLRYNTHDGISQTVFKALLMEQYCITTIDNEGMTNVCRNYRDMCDCFEYVNMEIDGGDMDLTHPRNADVRATINNFDFLEK